MRKRQTFIIITHTHISNSKLLLFFLFVRITQEWSKFALDFADQSVQRGGSSVPSLPWGLTAVERKKPLTHIHTHTEGHGVQNESPAG